MSEVFLKIVNMSISASWIVLAVLLLRILLKKAPKWITVLLWGIVGIRLIFPFSIESAMSLIPSAETISPEIMTGSSHSIHTGIPIINSTVNPIINKSFTSMSETSANPLQIWIPILSIIWLMGIVILLAYTFISYWRVHRKNRTAVLLRDNLYQSENVVSPFVLGVIKPKIYLPFNMSKQDEELVIAHEEAHIRRKDNFWKPFGFIILALHWFNPLMWLGYVLFCRDVEFACDERVVKELTNEQRADYSQALLTFSVNHRMIAACPLAFGEAGIKERVKSVLNYKKPAFWIIIVSVIALIVASVCLLTNPKKELDDKLKVFLDMQVAEHNGSDESDDNFAAISYDLMKLDESDSTITVYAWILYQEYSCENGVLTEETGSYVPTAITAKENDTTYELVEYWEPRGGELFENDIKNKFPMYLWSRAIDSRRSVYKQTAECEQMAKKYFGILENTVGDVSEPQNIVLANTTYRYESNNDMATLSLSATDNTGYFSYSILSDYMAYGTYEDDGTYIVLKTDDGKFKYTFKKENDTMKFVASKSSELPSYAYSSGAKAEICVPDGAVFAKEELEVDNAIDTIVFDIDKDGKDESCVLEYGPTSGLFTFVLSISENGELEYYDTYTSPFYYLSFDVQDDILRIKAITQDDPPKTEYFDVAIEEKHIRLLCNGQYIGYWGEQGLYSPYVSKDE